MYKCPKGDVTGAELAVCTVWQGVIYTSDDKGNIELLPAEGAGCAGKADLPGSRPVAAICRPPMARTDFRRCRGMFLH